MTSSCRVQRLLRALLLLALAVPSASLWAQGNFVYTNDDPLFAPNTVSGFSVAPNGTLTVLPDSPFATGGSGGGGGFFASNRVIVSPAANLLFASNAGSGDISVFSINPSSGALTLVSGSPFATGGAQGAVSLAATADGKFLLAANGSSNEVTVFSIAGNGALTPITGALATSTFPTVDIPDAAVVSRNGKFLAVAEPFSDQVEMFSMAASGALTSLGAFSATATGGFLASVDMNCSSSFLYGGEASGGPTLVDIYSIASGGTLAGLASSPFAPPVGRNSNVVLLSRDDKLLFVSNQGSGTLTVASVAGDGSLSLVTGSPFPMISAASPAGMDTSADGKLLYVAEFENMVSVFSVAANGALTEVAGSPFATGQTGFGGVSSLAAYPPKTCVAPRVAPAMQIMIKPPAAAPVPIQPRSRGKIPVAILSTATFNAVTQVDATSLTFGRTGDETSLAFCNRGGEDVNGDGLPDLVCHFNAQQAGFRAGDTSAILKGKTAGGQDIQASEGIVTVGR